MGLFKIAGTMFAKQRENNGINWKKFECKCYFDKITGHQLYQNSTSIWMFYWQI